MRISIVPISLGHSALMTSDALQLMWWKVTFVFTLLKILCFVTCWNFSDLITFAIWDIIVTTYLDSHWLQGDTLSWVILIYPSTIEWKHGAYTHDYVIQLYIITKYYLGMRVIYDFQGKVISILIYYNTSFDLYK